jgi:hypothetical protein
MVSDRLIDVKAVLCELMKRMMVSTLRELAEKGAAIS